MYKQRDGTWSELANGIAEKGVAELTLSMTSDREQSSLIKGILRNAKSKDFNKLESVRVIKQEQKGHDLVVTFATEFDTNEEALILLSKKELY